MGRGIFEGLLGSLGETARGIADKRRAGHNLKYQIADAINSAFAVFFFQHPSILQFQRAMAEKKKRNNMETLFGVVKIPSDNQIRTLIDGIEPGEIGKTFNETLKRAEGHGVIDQYRVLDGGVLAALDGVWYHSSEKVSCKRCLHKEKEGVTTYYHSILAATIVKPGSNAVLPLMGEMISNEDGNEKQDCERNAAKRWFSAHDREYAWLKPTFLGDDLFSNYPLCKDILERGASFIFTCKPASHPWLTETVTNSYLNEYIRKDWNGRKHLIYRYRWLNGVEIRDTKETLLVNYLELEIRNGEKGKTTYGCSWITDKTVDVDNVQLLVSCARARWKIENEHNNVLKNHGYNLEHNFGHGENHASEIFCLLNLLAFQFHTILDLADEEYQKAHALDNRRDEFFNHLRAALRYALHENWLQYIIFVRCGPPDD
jgi:hypothetical protein